MRFSTNLLMRSTSWRFGLAWSLCPPQEVVGATFSWDSVRHEVREKPDGSPSLLRLSLCIPKSVVSTECWALLVQPAKAGALGQESASSIFTFSCTKDGPVIQVGTHSIAILRYNDEICLSQSNPDANCLTSRYLNSSIENHLYRYIAMGPQSDH
jgi:hypothetical protein